MDERGRQYPRHHQWCGKPLTEQQQADYKAGKTIRLENVTDKQGQHAIMYVKFNPEKGRPYRYDENPDKAPESRPVERKPDTGSRKQRGQDERSDQEHQGAATAGTVSPEG